MKYLFLILLLVALMATGFYYKWWQPEPVTQELSGNNFKQKADAKIDENSQNEVMQQPLSKDFNTDTVFLKPTLDESHKVIVDTLASLSAKLEWLQWIGSDQLLRKFVVVVDNLAEGRLARKYIPIPAPAKSYQVEVKGEKEYLLSESYARYDGYIDILNSLDKQQLISTYIEFSPWLEEAFAELGYPPGRNFEATLMQAIDRVLAIESLPAGEHELTHTSVVYKFKDPTLESRSAMEKQFLRMGPKNLQMLQNHLQEFKLALKLDGDPNAAAKSPDTSN